MFTVTISAMCFSLQQNNFDIEKEYILWKPRVAKFIEKDSKVLAGAEGRGERVQFHTGKMKSF